MAQLHFNYLDHLIKGLNGELSEDVKGETIKQLKELIEKDKDKVKIKSGNAGIIPGEVRH